MKRLTFVWATLLCVACGGGGSSPSTTTTTATPSPAPTPAPAPRSSSAGQRSAAQLAVVLGKPQRFLIGLGTGNEPATINAQGVRPDIYDRYLSGAFTGSAPWPEWNSPRGAYVNNVAAEADALGAVPMFTLYQMASQGENNLAVLNNTAFMTTIWADTRLLFQRLALYDKPAIVNLEPDFWGFAQRTSAGDPTRLPALVTLAGECAGLPNNVAGVAGCMVQMARTYAPKALVAFPPSSWGGNSTAEVVAFMRAIGAGNGDLTIIQTLDRDAGCFEAQATQCTRNDGPWYWDETNIQTPNFRQHFAEARQYYQGLGLPLLWWQTPMGVPASTAGTTNRFRDNRVRYFLTRPAELVAEGALGVVFSAGAGGQTTMATDNGQFQTLWRAVQANPVALP